MLKMTPPAAAQAICVLPEIDMLSTKENATPGMSAGTDSMEPNVKAAITAQARTPKV